MPTLKKVLATNLISDPVFFFPTFYTLKLAMADPQHAIAAPLSTVSTALGKYREGCFADWRNTWLVWIPGHAITYGICPVHLRMPWIACVSFGYLMILSLTRGGV